MALLRRGSSRISEANFESRLQREKAKEGAITTSLAWNDPSDLDLHAFVYLASGGMQSINYGNARAAGGFLDVDMHARDGSEVAEPVENIFWKKPPAGTYSIHVHLYRKRGTRGSAIPFRALLKREDEEDLSKEGEVGEESTQRSVECFRFSVDEDGEVKMGRVGTPYPGPAPTFKQGGLASHLPAMRATRNRATTSMKAMKAMKVMKVMKKVMKKKAMKVSTVAKGKRAKVQVYRGLKGKIKTSGGLKKEDLIKNKKRKIVSAKKSKQGAESKWAKARKKAYEIKGYSGFKAVKRGSSFYAKAKEVMAEM